MPERGVSSHDEPSSLLSMRTAKLNHVRIPTHTHTDTYTQSISSEHLHSSMSDRSHIICIPFFLINIISPRLRFSTVALTELIVTLSTPCLSKRVRRCLSSFFVIHYLHTIILCLSSLLLSPSTLLSIYITISLYPPICSPFTAICSEFNRLVFSIIFLPHYRIHSLLSSS